MQLQSTLLKHSQTKMLLFYRIIIWGTVLFEGVNAAGILQVPLQEPTNSWLGQFAFHFMGTLLFEVLWWLNKKWGLNMSPHFFLWLVAAMVHDLPGSIYGLFTRYPWYDQIAHGFLMGYFLCWITLQFVRGIFVKRGICDAVLLLAGAVCLAAFLGVINEVLEYLLDQVSGRPVPSGISNDTANDLLMNSLGAGLFLITALAFNLPSLRDQHH